MFKNFTDPFFGEPSNCLNVASSFFFKNFQSLEILFGKKPNTLFKKNLKWYKRFTMPV